MWRRHGLLLVVISPWQASHLVCWQSFSWIAKKKKKETLMTTCWHKCRVLSLLRLNVNNLGRVKLKTVLANNLFTKLFKVAWQFSQGFSKIYSSPVDEPREWLNLFRIANSNNVTILQNWKRSFSTLWSDKDFDSSLSHLSVKLKWCLLTVPHNQINENKWKQSLTKNGC